MSSTTERRAERGQVLVLFCGALLTLMLVLALAFDVGTMLVERRDQQNAADAAAIAGARFLPGNTSAARAQAVEIARQNGFEDGVGGTSLTIRFGSWSPAGGFLPGAGTGAIQVQIGRGRPSVFAGVIGRSSWDVSASGVAVNQTTTSGPFALLSLHPTACPGLRIEGSGTVTSAGNLQVNSSCTSGDRAFRVAGTGSLDLIATGIGCNVVGGWSRGGSATLHDCNPPNLGAPAISDPYASLANPPRPGLPSPMRRWDPSTNTPHSTNTPPPNGCPGSTLPATDLLPALCDFGGAFAGQTWRVYPGYYPGGINITSGGATFLLEPGLYWIGDGGFRVANAHLRSVDAGGLDLGGGVLIFNGTHVSPLVNPNKIVLQGGTAQVQLWPLNGTGSLADYDRFVIFQDRSITLDVEIHGGGANTLVRGIIYAPTAHVLVQGNSGTLTVDQIVASTYAVRGDAGTITVAFDAGFLPQLRYAGLVE